MGGQRGQDGGERGLVEGGGEAFSGEDALAGAFPAEEVAGEMAQHREVLGGVTGADAIGVLLEGSVQDPMDAVLNGLIANGPLC